MAGPPNSINQKVTSGTGVPVLKTVTVNGQQLDEARFKSINQTGGVPFPDGSSGLRYRVGWREVLGNGRFVGEFEIPTDKLSALKSDRSFLDIQILIGPGADITVQTSNQDALRLNEERRFDEITDAMRIPTVILETCARAMGSGDPFASALGRTVTSGELSRAQTAQSRAQARRGVPVSRCGSGG
jgi:hypothetical protein